MLIYFLGIRGNGREYNRNEIGEFLVLYECCRNCSFGFVERIVGECNVVDNFDFWNG